VSAVAMPLTYFQKQPKSGSNKPVSIAINAALGMIGSTPNSSMSTIKHTAPKRSLQERCFDLSLARALLGGMGTHHHTLSNNPVPHEEKTFVLTSCFAYLKLAKFFMFTRKNS